MICATCGVEVEEITVTPTGLEELPCGHRGVMILGKVEWQKPSRWQPLETITWRVVATPAMAIAKH